MPSLGRCVSSGAPRAGRAVAEARPGMRWATWSARALSHSNAWARRANVEFVRRLVAKVGILMLQETQA